VTESDPARRALGFEPDLAAEAAAGESLRNVAHAVFSPSGIEEESMSARSGAPQPDAAARNGD